MAPSRFGRLRLNASPWQRVLHRHVHCGRAESFLPTLNLAGRAVQPDNDRQEFEEGKAVVVHGIREAARAPYLPRRETRPERRSDRRVLLHTAPSGRVSPRPTPNARPHWPEAAHASAAAFTRRRAERSLCVKRRSACNRPGFHRYSKLYGKYQLALEGRDAKDAPEAAVQLEYVDLLVAQRKETSWSRMFDKQATPPICTLDRGPRLESGGGKRRGGQHV